MIQNIFSTLMAYADPSETETADAEQNLRKDCRGPTSNPRSNNQHIYPTISPNSLSPAISPKRLFSSSNDTISLFSVKQTSCDRRKKTKTSSSNSFNTQQSVTRKCPFTTTLGSLNLTWPKYKINNGVYANQSFSITNTCPVDTGLFVLYHAYKAGTDEFRNLFENNALDAFTALRRTFEYVETDNWTTARLYWLVRHQLLDMKDDNGTYNLFNTLTKIVFDFVRPMQQFEIKSQCTCIACPKRYRQHLSFDIALR
jgi:hypothetical protein